MKTFVVFTALVAVALAAKLPVKRRQVIVVPELQQQQQQQTYVVRETPSNNIGLDGYQFGYELSDGQVREESAQVVARSANPEDAVLNVRGSFSWIDPATGQTYSVSYVADENGFQPQGAHLPRPQA